VAPRTTIPILTLALCACSSPPVPQSAAKPQAGPVRITQFYASPSNPAKGEKSLVCYGVENASELRLDPPVEKVWPAASHCFNVVPSKEVTYTLTALRGSEQDSKSVTIKPGPPAVKILEVSVNKLEVARGEPVTVCYKARNAIAVTILPGTLVNPHSLEFGCVQDHPRQATAYTVDAAGAGDGNTDSERVTVKVK
jgi:hypothetical protein